MRAARSNGSQAASVSRALARGGHRPIGSGTGYVREGLHVKRSSTALAHVVASYDSPVKARQALANAADILDEAGYTTETHDVFLRVTGRKPEAPRFVRVAPGDYEADGIFRLVKLDGGATQAWNVEWTTEFEERLLYGDDSGTSPGALPGYPVDGARTKADALEFFAGWWREYGEEFSARWSA